MDLQLELLFHRAPKWTHSLKKTCICLLIACATVLPGSIWKRGINSSQTGWSGHMFPWAVCSEATQFLADIVTKIRSRKHPCCVISPVGTAGSVAGAGGQHAQPSHSILLAGGLHCRHLQHFPGFLLTRRPSAKGGFSAGSASFQQDHSVLTDNSARPPSKPGCFTPTSVLLRIFLVRHMRSLPICHPVYNQTFSAVFFNYYYFKLRRQLP